MSPGRIRRKGRTTTNRAYIEEGAIVPSPDAPPAQPNTVIEAVEDALTNKLGIAPNMNIPAPGQTRAPLAANIRHALVYCFQQQSEIASKDILFHGQYDGWIAQAIKDTVAYFLGAIQEDRLALEQELARARRELKRAEQLLREAEAITGDGVSKASGLYQEARQVGVTPDELIPENLEELRARFAGHSSLDAGIGQLSRFGKTDPVFRKKFARCSFRRGKRPTPSTPPEILRGKRKASSRKRASSNYGSNPSACLMPESNRAQVCPVCTQELETPVPTAEAMRRSLELLKANLESTVRERPRLRGYIEGLEKEREEIRQRIREKNEDIRSLLEEHEAARNCAN